MASSNSTKKLAKVARSGKKRSIRESSDRTYPMIIVGIIVVGALLVAWGRNERASAQRVTPTLLDHWHQAFGLYVCDAFQPAPTDAGPDVLGIHTHDDGIIHIHPYSSSAAGEGATIDKFFDQVGYQVTDSKLVLPDSTTYESGVTTCPSGEVGTLALVKWKSADDPDAKPEVITKDIAKARFTDDRAAFTLAFVPEAKLAEVPRPESIPTLDNLSDVDPSATSTTAATATSADADSTGTTSADATATTAAGSGSTATTATGGPATTAAGSSGSTTTAASATSTTAG